MESIKNNTEDLLVDSLSFKLPGSGQYVVDRRSCTFHTEGIIHIVHLMGQECLNLELTGRDG